MQKRSTVPAITRKAAYDSQNPALSLGSVTELHFVLQKIFTVEKKRHRLVAGAGKLLLGVWDIAGLLHETGAVGAEDIIDEGLGQACGLALGVHVQQARDLIRA